MMGEGSRHSAEKDTCKVMTEMEHMNIVIVGHVDHGKSTIIRRLWQYRVLAR
jgi:translation elongation factor EF-Tu-like GTPase